MAFSAQDLELLDRTSEVDIETIRANGTPRRTTIWIMVDGEQVYVRSVRGPAGDWYRSIVRAGEGRVHAGERAWSIGVAPVTDADEIERVSAAIRRKYERRWAGPTASMLLPETLGTTLRVMAM